MTRHWIWAALAPGIVFLTSPAFAEGDPAAGQARATVCAACHGIDGNSINPEWPSLAGQGASYMVTQLKRFQSGERENVLMAPQASLLSEQDILDVSAFYAAQTPKIGVAQADQKTLDLGELIYRGGILERGIPSCIACHGPGGAATNPPNSPRPAASMLVIRLASLNPSRGFRHTRSHPAEPMMNEVAQMTDEEIEAVAHYISPVLRFLCGSLRSAWRTAGDNCLRRLRNPPIPGRPALHG